MPSTSLPRRRSARVAATMLAGAGVLMAGATAASAASPPVDINGDGVLDQYSFDTNGDGLLDSWLTDSDNDGIIDETTLDVDFNTTPDYWFVDWDQDGVLDQIQVDTNGDRYPDSLVIGYAYDTVWGPNPQAPGTGVADCLTPQGGLPVNIPTHGDCAWLQTLATNSGIGLNPGAVIADAIKASSPRVL